MVTRDQAIEQRLETGAVLERICVRPPYFALSGLKVRGSIIEATARAETPHAFEVGPMNGFELGRHAAIAGSCCAALAQTDGRRRYYLAQQAEAKFYANEALFGSPVRLQAKLLALNKRQARTLVEAEADGRPLGQCEIHFTILNEGTFHRLFDWRRQETPATANPYTQLLSGKRTRGDSWTKMVIPRIPVSACVGHFESFPVLPVSVITGYLSELAGQMLAELPIPYRVAYASLEARDLIWAGERAEFRVEHTKSSRLQHTFSCTVLTEERIVTTMALILETFSETERAFEP